MTAKTFAICQRKGGIGKTTSTISLSVEFARKTDRTLVLPASLASKSEEEMERILKQEEQVEKPAATVLAIEADPQRNLSRSFGVALKPGDKSLYEVLLNPQYGIEYAVQPTRFGVDLLPSSAPMVGIEQELVTTMHREYKLHDALKDASGDTTYPVAQQAVDQYRYIFIDTPANLGLLTINAMVAADILLVPMEVSVYSYDAMDDLKATIELIKKVTKVDRPWGIFCTLSDTRRRLGREIEEAIRSEYGERVFQTVIHINSRIAEAPVYGEPIQVYDQRSKAAIEYAALAQEILERFQ
jgi:chromosome partitioning protein